jgi:hypothetical protein
MIADIISIFSNTFKFFDLKYLFIKIFIKFILQNPENNIINLPKNGAKLIIIIIGRNLDFVIISIFEFNSDAFWFAGAKILEHIIPKI